MDYQSSTPTTGKLLKNSNQKNINIINLLNEQHEIVKNRNPSIPTDILDDLSSRFIINIPNEERDDIIRILFQIELAQWFYCDFYVVEYPELIKYNFKPFAKLMFNHVPSLRQYLGKFDEVIDKWKDYKQNVPTYGAVILDEAMENVLMVQGFWSNTTWGFPKGKINAEEDPVVCACREVKEEIGFDCTNLIESTEFIEMHIRDTYIRLYIIAGVNKNENFHPLTRNEIKKIQWFPIKDLPASRQENKLNPNAFFMVIPIIKSLKRWIYERRTKNSDYSKSFNYNFQIGRNQQFSPVSKQHSKENHYSTNKNMTQQHPSNNHHHNHQQNHQQNVNGNNSNRMKSFNPTDKISILKNPKNSQKSTKHHSHPNQTQNNQQSNKLFCSSSFMNFNLNYDKLWAESLIQSGSV